MVNDRARGQAVLRSASDLIRGFCDQELSVVLGEVEVFTGVDLPTLVLSERPVTGITSVIVSGFTVTDFTFTRAGVITRNSDAWWSSGATVTYDHGYLESDWQFGVFRAVALEVAARALSLNERSASEAIGSTLMESAGYSPEVFLTPGEQAQLASFGKVLIG
jgi:hypothetical protein